jgi:hypothetical protein
VTITSTVFWRSGLRSTRASPPISGGNDDEITVRHMLQSRTQLTVYDDQAGGPAGICRARLGHTHPASQCPGQQWHMLRPEHNSRTGMRYGQIDHIHRRIRTGQLQTR